MLELLLVPAVVDDADQLDDAAAVDHVVGRIQNPGLAQPIRVGRPAELVVRRACDDPAAQSWDRIRVHGAPDRARRIDVALRADHRVGRDERVTVVALLVDVGDENRRSLGGQVACERSPYRAQTLHEHRSSGEIR